MSKQPPPAPTTSAVGPCPTIIQISRTPWYWKFTQHHCTTRPPPKFHENILKGISYGADRKVNGRTDRRRDRRTVRGHDIIQPIFDGPIKMRDFFLHFYTKVHLKFYAQLDEHIKVYNLRP